MSAVPVLVDGDSCPREARAILQRAAARGRIELEVFANRALPTREGEVAATVVTGSVDDRLAQRARDRLSIDRRCLVVTRDIPLAERLLTLGVDVINDRGTRFMPDSIGERRSIRDAAAAIRANGLESMERRRGYGAAQRKAFADALDRYLTRCTPDGNG